MAKRVVGSGLDLEQITVWQAWEQLHARVMGDGEPPLLAVASVIRRVGVPEHERAHAVKVIEDIARGLAGRKRGRPPTRASKTYQDREQNRAQHLAYLVRMREAELCLEGHSLRRARSQAITEVARGGRGGRHMSRNTLKNCLKLANRAQAARGFVPSLRDAVRAIREGEL